MPERMDAFERKRAIRRRKARRKRIKRTLLALLLLSISAAIILSLTVWFPINIVRSQGSECYSEKEIVAAAKIKGENMFTTTSSSVLNKVRKKLPYIEELDIKRYFPDGVKLEVKDAVDYTYFEYQGKFYTVSEKGFVLSCLDDEPQNCFKTIAAIKEPKLANEIEYENINQKESVELIKNKMRENGFEINEINVESAVKISVRICNRFDVILGTENNLDKKIAHLKGMVSNIAENRTGTIDLSMWTPSNSEGSFVEN